MDGQCDKLVTVVGHQFITLTVLICVQHGGREAMRRAGLSAVAEKTLLILPTCLLDHGSQDAAYAMVCLQVCNVGAPWLNASMVRQLFCIRCDSGSAQGAADLPKYLSENFNLRL